MGQNRRYDLVGRDLDRAAAREMRMPRPVGLTPEELATTGRRVDAPEPVPVRAMVRHRTVIEEGIPVEAVAVAWTQRAVLLRWSPDGDPQHAVHVWVWAGAVRRR